MKVGQAIKKICILWSKHYLYKYHRNYGLHVDITDKNIALDNKSDTESYTSDN